jgi:glycosyltransferase involved in cell wall biosynthesis
VILGDGSLKQELIELAKQLHILDKTLFLGRIKNDEIPRYLSLADIVVGPSLYSNLNRSIQEAMACQIPVVVFASGRTGELIKDMENGLLISRGEIDSFADALEVLYRDRDLRERLGKNARLTILSHRNWDARIHTELEVYHRILGR